MLINNLFILTILFGVTSLANATSMVAEVIYQDNEVKKYQLDAGATRFPMRLKNWECSTVKPEKINKSLVTRLTCKTKENTMQFSFACDKYNDKEKKFFTFADDKSETRLEIQCLE